MINIIDNLREESYRIKQKAMMIGFTLWGRLWHQVFSGEHNFVPDPGLIRIFQERFDELLDKDLQNVKEDYYPRAVIEQFSLGSYLLTYFTNLDHQFKVFQNKREGNFKQFPQNVDLNQYPVYYRRNFHWQEDGWLSDQSARLYDTGVEFLFGGTADIMRRMAIRPIFDHINAIENPKLVDIACGTGRLVNLIARLRPHMPISAFDLSEYYLDYARDQNDAANISYNQGNAEYTHYVDDQFDVTNSTFLFHELPQSTRKTVLKEMARITKPGGIVVATDSIQVNDSPRLRPFMNFFSQTYHEPFYQSYIEEPLEQQFEEARFKNIQSEVILYSKLVWGTQ